ncbi:SAV_915 family protein [Streptomyces sp. NPDC000151]|uniref:SAV_915 family protein n=1 Tax=Streptomyces sp. NPDC000151 TaxID=3154244 RepID=UPI003331929B
MADTALTDDPEPLEPVPDGPLYVPVRPGPMGYTARLCRTPLGGRTAVGFTTERGLVSALGPGQPWIRLAEPALRALTAPLGITRVTVDPRFTAPNPRTADGPRAAAGPRSTAPARATDPARTTTPARSAAPARATAPAGPFLVRGRAS